MVQQNVQLQPPGESLAMPTFAARIRLSVGKLAECGEISAKTNLTFSLLVLAMHRGGADIVIINRAVVNC